MLVRLDPCLSRDDPGTVLIYKFLDTAFKMQLATILFYLFSLLTVVSAGAVVYSKNPVYSVLWLIFAFFNSAGLFVLLGAEMLAMLLVIVYVGAVAVLFLFVVMMLNIKSSTLKKSFQSYLPVGLLLATILFIEIFAVITFSVNKVEEDEKVYFFKKTEVEKIVDEDKNSLLDEVLKADKEAEQKPRIKIRNVNKNTNAHKIGNVLYTEYFLMFQISGLILFVAMIGAIVLTHREREGVKRQKIDKQNSRSRKNSLKIVQVETGKGV